VLKIDNEQIYAFDIDDTLVMWEGNIHQPDEHGRKLAIVDPYDKTTVFLKPHQQHIKLVKQMHGRGRFVMVWSAGGVQWAEAVVKALNLEPYVGLIITKPVGYVDDLPANKFLQNHIYLPEKPEVETT